MKVHLNRSMKIVANLILAAGLLLSSLAPAGSAQAAPLAQGDIPPVTLISPADGSVTYASTAHARALPSFYWQAVPGAVTYKLEIDTSPTFNSIGLYTVTTKFNQWAPYVANLPDQAAGMYWHVKVKSMTGVSGEGPYGDTWTFYKDWTRKSSSVNNTTTLLAPDDDAVMAFTDHPTFSWTPVVGATYYRVEFSLNDTFTSLVHLGITLNTTYQPTSKIADGTYYWRVVPMQDGMPDWTGKESQTRIITFDYNAAFLPTLIAPDNGSNQQYTPTFRWTAVLGAQKYYLDYSTDQYFASKTTIDTFGTSYTPTSPLTNDQSYYWRVRVLSGNSNNQIYTPTWQFYKKWYPPVTLLTPTNGYQYAWDPYFSWAPVPGAASYRIEVDDQESFASPLIGNTTNTFFVYSSKTKNCPPFTAVPHADPLKVFWRVIPLDSKAQRGEPSPTGTFDCHLSAGAPIQVYPNMYYLTTTDPPMNPHEDNTAPIPAFLWKRVLIGPELTQAAAYRIQVANSPGFAPASIKYTFDTENMNAVPTQASLLPHGGGQTDYFWRVRQLTSLGGAETGQWSQIWRMRHNPALLPPKTASIQLLRPATGSEWVETVPLFEWMPLQNATSYQAQISQNSDMSSPLGTYAVDYPAYSHPNRLAPGTYYWRVQGMNGATQMGWSAPIRFQIAAQSRWRSFRSLGANNTPVIASDPVGDAGVATYDLTNLSITQGESNWYFGFNVNNGADMKYAVYIDADHVDNSGATLDPEGYGITTIPAHRPENVIYIDKVGGTFNADNVRVYTWNSALGVWNPVSILSSLAGAGITYDGATGYLEFTVRGSYVSQSTEKNSMSVSVVSLPNSGGRPQDSVPSDPNVSPGAGGSTQLNRFVSVTDRVTLLTPPYRVASDPKTFSTLPAFTWQPVVEVPEATYYVMRDGVDPSLTSWLTAANNNNPAIFSFLDDINGDNTYYWQVRAAYLSGTTFLGGWSQAGKVERKGLPALGLAVTYDLWTPVLSWTMTEGAYEYILQIDDDAAFASPIYLSNNTKLNTYTPDSKTFADGKTYYARVQTKRTSSITNVVSNVVTFAVQRPQVTGLHTIPDTNAGSPARYNPTYCWNPIASAFEYLLEISWDSAFSVVYDAATSEENCYTFPWGMLDGSFYWRVRMLDGSGEDGPPSIHNQAWKYYPAPTPLYPLKVVDGTPMFKWSPVDGADRYVIEIADKPDVANVLYRGTTVNTEHQPTKPLDFGDYYWRVKIIDRDNIEGPFSDFVYVEYYKSFLPTIRK